MVIRHMNENYDAVISRGGTARLIEQVTDIPVVDISLSVYDILRAIKLAENYQEKYAIVGFPSITSSAYMLCDLLQYKIDIFTIHSEEEVRSLLTKLRAQGYHMVVCDMVSYTEAKSLGLNAILITSGVESIQDALDRAVKISSSQMKTRKDNLFLKAVLKNSINYTIIFDAKDGVYLSTWDKKNEAEVLDVLRRELPHVRSSTNHKIFRTINGTLFSIVGRVLPYEGQQYVVFYFTVSKVPINPGKYGIRFSNKKEAEEQFYNSIYSITGIMGDLADSIGHISQSSFPVMIAGEIGTGQEHIAQAIYIQSPLHANPLVTIDCSQLTDRGWNFLINHYNSPLNDNDNTIYFKNLEALGPERSRQLLSFIVDTNLYHRNRLIFSCNSQKNSLLPPEGQEYVRRLSCLTICLPPLRERIHEFPTLASIYLSFLNIELDKQLAGFESKAMEMLMNYDWPENYIQFKRLIRELAVITVTPYITSNSVAILLDKERSSINNPYKDAFNNSMDLERPLKDIIRDVVKKALANNRGNQSLTAKQLKISRTTLWRYLKS
nr:MAG: propionate catabolism operon regulatory protein PrpR [Caldicoprobacter oshimai]